ADRDVTFRRPQRRMHALDTGTTRDVTAQQFVVRLLELDRDDSGRGEPAREIQRGESDVGAGVDDDPRLDAQREAESLLQEYLDEDCSVAGAPTQVNDAC